MFINISYILCILHPSFYKNSNSHQAKKKTLSFKVKKLMLIDQHEKNNLSMKDEVNHFLSKSMLSHGAIYSKEYECVMEE